MKRFYKDATAAPADQGFAVLLDGKPVRTPGGQPLILPTARLAEAVAEEWRAQGEEINPAGMPLLRLSNTVLDGVIANRREVIDAALRFGESDLLCYRAHQPPDLAARQRKGWDPWLDWLRQRHSASLKVGQGLEHVAQPADGLMALRRAVEALDPFSLGALQVIASITGSLVLALAVADGALGGDEAFQLSRIDETYQAEKWGEDAEAAKRAAALAQELGKAVELMTAARPTSPS